MSALAKFKSHKIVAAGKLRSIDSEDTVTVEDANGADCKVEIPSGMFARGVATIGDYIVIYDDGYKSWSPAKAFEDGYTRVEA